MVGKHPATIELNGQRFDAYTGKSLSIEPVRPIHKPSLSDVLPVKRALAPRSVTQSKQMHKSPARSATLMRSAVRKPDIFEVSRPIKQASAPAPTTKPATIPSFHTPIDGIRTERAQHIKQSSLISRFSRGMNTVAQTATHVTRTDGAKRPIHQMDVVAAPVHRHVAVQHTAVKPAPSSAAHHLTEKGLRDAPAHLPKKVKKQRLHHRIGRRLGLKPRAASLGAVSLALLLLGGFIAYQNVPNLAVRYASMKAGVDASLPSYQPAGFAINDRVKYSPGEVSVAYKANSDDRSYTVTQKSSAWNNDSLKDYVATTSGKEPQSFPENGKTIYLYGDSNAAWVDSGVLYKISGDSSLNTDQLIKIASSM